MNVLSVMARDVELEADHLTKMTLLLLLLTMMLRLLERVMLVTM